MGILAHGILTGPMLIVSAIVIWLTCAEASLPDDLAVGEPLSVDLHNFTGVVMQASEASDEMSEKRLEMVSVAVAVQCFGSVAFMMLVFYMVHWPDKDMEKASWKVVSGTISIFCAVLMFQALNAMLSRYIIGGGEEAPFGCRFAWKMAHVMFWAFMLQVSLAYISGAVTIEEIKQKLGKKTENLNESLIQEQDEELSPEELKRRKTHMSSVCILIGHIMGFACIDAFGAVQQKLNEIADAFILQVVFAVVTCCASVAIIVYYYSLTDKLREYISKADSDGKIDEQEELWDDVTEETEDDVMGLLGSFLFVQALRLMICGKLPNAEGEDEDKEGHTFLSGSVLAMCALVIASAVVAETLKEQKLETQEEGKEEEEEPKILLGAFTGERIKEWCQIIACMSFAWCMFFSVDWTLDTGFTLYLYEPLEEDALLGAMRALVISVLGFFGIYVLDQLADADFTVAATDKALRQIGEALAILIGFGWERSFDTSVVVIVDAVTWAPPELLKLAMSLALCILVWPGWRLYILPTVLELEEEEIQKSKSQNFEPEQSPVEAPLNTRDLKLPGKNNDAGRDALVAEINRRGARIKELEASLLSITRMANEAADQLPAA